MPMGKNIRYVLFGAALLISGCNTVRHVDYQEEQSANSPVELAGLRRTVEIRVDPAYNRLTANCVTVLPISGTTSAPLPLALNEAMARHLRDRFGEVIGPHEAMSLSRRLVVDLAHPGDRALYARKTQCPLFVELTPWGSGSTYALVWTRRMVGAEARLTDAAGDTVYWRARHAATRADGGLPFSPIDIAVSLFQATKLQQDQDVNLSLADDLARRLVATIPDMGLPPSPSRLLAGRRLDTR